MENCETCAEFLNIRKTNKPTLAPFDKSVAALWPMQHVQADLFELKAGLVFLVVIDLATNFICVEKIASKSCKNIKAGWEDIFLHFGYPSFFGSDNMLGFTGKELGDYLKKHGIHRNPGAPYYSNHQQYAEGMINIVK